MSVQKPLTIEVLGETTGTHAVVLDRVIGATIYLDEAKRIARRLLEVADEDIPPQGYRILSHDQQVIYEWRVTDDETTGSA